jgi:hypothetical protein
MCHEEIGDFDDATELRPPLQRVPMLRLTNLTLADSNMQPAARHTNKNK